MDDRKVRVAADQPALSECDLNGPIRRMYQNDFYSTTVVSVELARLVGGTVVVRVADRRQSTIQCALQTKIHLELARNVVHHSLSTALIPFPA